MPYLPLKYVRYNRVFVNNRVHFSRVSLYVDIFTYKICIQSRKLLISKFLLIFSYLFFLNQIAIFDTNLVSHDLRVWQLIKYWPNSFSKYWSTRIHFALLAFHYKSMRANQNQSKIAFNVLILRRQQGILKVNSTTGQFHQRLSVVIDQNSVRFRFRPKFWPKPKFRFRFLQDLDYLFQPKYRFKNEPKLSILYLSRIKKSISS
jgi:hypothetical protein